MSKIKVSELEGEKLAEWAARAQRWTKTKGNSKLGEYEWYWNDRIPCFEYRPDINGGQAMELVKRLNIAIVPPELSGLEKWAAGSVRHYILPNGQVGDHELGETPEIAICRAAVASVFGEYVDDD